MIDKMGITRESAAWRVGRDMKNEQGIPNHTYSDAKPDRARSCGKGLTGPCETERKRKCGDLGPAIFSD